MDVKGVVTPMRISLTQTCENGKTVIFCVFLTKVLKICYITNPVINPLTNGKRMVALCCEWLRIMTLLSEIRWAAQVIFV